MMPTIGMCRRPAIRSTSGLTTRVTALISRRARGPKRIALLPARGGAAAGPSEAAGPLPASPVGGPAVPRPCGVDILNLLGQLDYPAALTNKDERAADNVTFVLEVADGSRARGR